MSDKNITLKSIIKTEAELKELGYCVQNNIIKRVVIDTAEFNFCNSVYLKVICSNTCSMGLSHKGNIDYLISSYIELFDLPEEDGLPSREIKSIPCRLIFNSPNGSLGSRCIGFGHFMKDKFVLTDDFVMINAI